VSAIVIARWEKPSFLEKLGFILDALRNGVFRLTASTELGQNTASDYGLIRGATAFM